jgi:CubicO group peptidase (beta-lactamase class C family)
MLLGALAMLAAMLCSAAVLAKALPTARPEEVGLWSGAATTKFYIDPAEDMVAVFFAQRRPLDDGVLNEFQTLLYQSIVR